MERRLSKKSFLRTYLCAAAPEGEWRHHWNIGHFTTAAARAIFIATLCLFLAACAAPAIPPAPVRPDSVYYLQPARVQALALPAPPLPGSPTDNDDLRQLKAWQEKRTAQQCALARYEARGDYEGLFGKISPFDPPANQEARDFFRRVLNDLDYAVGDIKDRYRRTRPFLRDKGLSPCIDRIGGYSYPSGHAVNARVFALILSELTPERREAFMDQADHAALHRVICGVHYPSDIAAGKLLGATIYDELTKSPDFQNDLRSLRKYVRAP